MKVKNPVVYIVFGKALISNEDNNNVLQIKFRRRLESKIKTSRLKYGR